MSQFEYFYVKITQRLYDKHTGQLGAYSFNEGVSVEKLHRNDAVNFSHGFQCVALDDNGVLMFPIISGKIPTDAELLTAKKAKAYAADVGKTKKVKKTKTKKVITENPNTDATTYTREQLEHIADARGLSGLREIGDQIGAKGKSIPELIEKILKVQ